MSGSTARTHSDAGTLELLADRAPMNAQLSTNLAQRLALGVQVGCTLNVHRATVAAHAKAVARWTAVCTSTCRIDRCHSRRIPSAKDHSGEMR